MTRQRTASSPRDGEARRLRRQVFWLLVFIGTVAYVAWLWPLGYAAAALEAVRQLVHRG